MTTALVDSTFSRSAPSRALLAEVAGRVQADPELPRSRALLGAYYAFVGLFEEGRWLGQAWAHAATLDAALGAAFERVRRDALEAGGSTLVCVVPTGAVVLGRGDSSHALGNTHRGIRGVGVLNGASPVLSSPTEALAKNQSPLTQLERLAETVGVAASRLLDERRVFAFDARQFHVDLHTGQLCEMTRGNVLVSEGELSRERVAAFERRLSAWMLTNVARDGRMTYGFYPSRSVERSDNNMVRQWMATVCLGRIARRCSNTWLALDPTDPLADPGQGLSPRARARAIADRNLRYNLHRFFRWEGELGYVQHGDLVYLGSAALALIAILESPLCDRLANERRGLLATIDSLSREDGSFQTFLRPKERTDNQNYFPGETLLAWALLYRHARSDGLIERILTSYRYYRDWHLAHRNPAFVPWHTQAYYQVLQERDLPELRDWVFEMNDWLVETMQSRARAVYDDTAGRFYHPHRRYGPPHASSTGVYLEGLADAYRLARSVGDGLRQERYERALRSGLRSAMQLQFSGDVDMYYVQERARVKGALRTAVHDNTIRVDNVQHVLMAVQKILEP
jgi:hypothetical protein